MMIPYNPNDEWLEADGLGGFASGTVSGIRTRRYHALLLAALTPPTGRVVLVNGFDAWVETPDGSFALSSQKYEPDVIHPDGSRRLVFFTPDPWPLWRFRLENGMQIEQEIFVRKQAPLVAVCWRLGGKHDNVRLVVRPFLSGRDYHFLSRENPTLRFDAATHDDRVLWRPTLELPAIVARSNGTYTHQPEWYRNFLYEEERTRGLDHVEDLASPGVFHWDLSHGEAVWLLSVANSEAEALHAKAPIVSAVKKLRTAERLRRGRFPSRLQRAADAYIVSRGAGKTIVAGYPWFTDWGRDTFIALRGLCLATGKVDAARDILLTWAGMVSEGMLPNRFPDRGEALEYNAVDAALWFVVAVRDFFQAMEDKDKKVTTRNRKTLENAVDAILDGYARGTRLGIRADDDGLLAAGVPGVPLTWMDVKIDDQVITPRIGKPVEVEALWLNALWSRRAASPRWADLFERGREAFLSRFWNDADGYLYDVIDCAHQRGTHDGTFRPNQILAVGGLPLTLLEGERARRVVDAVEARLWTPLGLRSLPPGAPGYCGRYEGDARQRDRAYHEGTVWPWLSGPFIEAWVGVRGHTLEARQEACSRFLDPLLKHLDQAGLGHVSEIADAEPPHTPRGCPFQAWSVGEVLRLMQVLVAG